MLSIQLWMNRINCVLCQVYVEEEKDDKVYLKVFSLVGKSKFLCVM